VKRIAPLILLAAVIVASGCVANTEPAQQQIDGELQLSHNKLFDSMTFDNQTHELTWSFEDEPVMVGEYSSTSYNPALGMPTTDYYDEDYKELTIQRTRLEHREEIINKNIDKLDFTDREAGTYQIEVLASKTSDGLLGDDTQKYKYKQEMDFTWNGTHIKYVDLHHAEEEWE